MTDLRIGIAIIVSASVLIAVAAARFTVRASTRTNALLLLSSLALTVAFALGIHGRLLVAEWLPFSNVLVTGNWIPLGVAVVIGVLFGRNSIPLWRRALLGVSLTAVAGFSLARPLTPTPPLSNESWSPDGVMIQSNAASCSACAAATLLHHHGISAGEIEMMKLCLTDRAGTPTLGLFRGVCLKTRNTLYRPQAFTCSIEELLAADNWPVVLLVRLERNADVDPIYQREWGWTPGQGHAVVVFGRIGNDRLDIGDPSIGREEWSLDDLRVLWHGEGVRLVPRSSQTGRP